MVCIEAIQEHACSETSPGSLKWSSWRSQPWSVQEGCTSLLAQARVLPYKLCCIWSLLCYILFLFKPLVEGAGPFDPLKYSQHLSSLSLAVETSDTPVTANNSEIPEWPR